MIVSTRGRYAVRALLEIAKTKPGHINTMGKVAKAQQISVKYLLAIVQRLKKHKLIITTKGKGGGIKLARPASQITLYDILKATEVSISPVYCLDTPEKCSRVKTCETINMWKAFDTYTKKYLKAMTLDKIGKKKH
ncbi:MAG: Rrf2 family transcriptional regulator [bacterium]